VESLIGAVPGGWIMSSLGEHCEILTGPSGAQSQLVPRGADHVPVVTSKAMRNNRLSVDDVSWLNRAAAERLQRYQLDGGDVVCSRIGDLDRRALVTPEQGGWLLGPSCLRLRPGDGLDPGYLLHYLAHPGVVEWVRRNASGSAVPAINTATLNAMPLAIAPPEVQATLGEVLGALDAKIDVHDRISQVTVELRDALLPRLFSGMPE
jgi:hypothetical protein